VRPVVLQIEVSLDGVICEENTPFYEFAASLGDDVAYDASVVDSFSHAGLHIMGRVTYEAMARVFPVSADSPDGDRQASLAQARSDENIADIMNRIPKAVFSRTLLSADWGEATIIRGDTADEIAALRRSGGGEIIAHGGARFAQSLASLDVIDEYRLTVLPYVAGDGRALFANVARPRRLEVVSSTAFSSGALSLVYGRRQ
jgi:dihydrofolate reductase